MLVDPGSTPSQCCYFFFNLIVGNTILRSRYFWNEKEVFATPLGANTCVTLSNLQLPPGEEVFHYQMVKPANFLDNGKAFFLYFISTYYKEWYYLPLLATADLI